MVMLIAITVCGAVMFLVSAVQVALNRLILNYQQTYESKMQQGLTELFLFVPVRQLLVIWCASAALVIVGLLMSNSGWLSYFAGILIVGAAPWQLYRYLRKHREKLFQQQLPDALLLIANSLRAGASLQAAMQFISQEMAAPVGQEFSLLLRQMRLGQPLAEVLEELEQRLPSIDCSRVTAAIALGHSAGGQQAPLFERLAASMRKKQHLQQRIQSLSAQGRMQGRVMTLLPVFLTAVLWAIETDLMQRLLQHPLGWVLGSTMIIMLSMGHWLMNRLLRIQVPL